MWRYTLIGLLPTLVVVVLLKIIENSIWPALLGYHAICLIIPLVSRCYLKEAGLVLSYPKRWLPLTVILSVLLITTSVVGSRFINPTPILLEGLETLIYRIRPRQLFAIYSLLMNSFLEEYFWRGFLLPKTGIIQGAVLFWLVHVVAILLFINPFSSVILTLPVFAFGLLWGWMRQRFETLLPCYFTHLASNVAIIFLIHQILSLK